MKLACLRTPLVMSAVNALFCSVAAVANESAELAQELNNPLADLITAPIQMNYDSGSGPFDKGSKLQTNIQPVYLIDLNAAGLIQVK